MRIPTLGVGVDQLDPLLAQLRERRVDVVDPVGDVVQPRALALEELADRGLGPERAQQLDVAVADVEQNRLDPLLVDRLAVGERHPEAALVERERGVEVGDGDADVIDQPEHRARRLLGEARAVPGGGSVASASAGVPAAGA